MEWVRQYECFGLTVFERTNNNHYALETKVNAVEYYLSGRGSLADTCRIFEIYADWQLRDWIKQYNSHNLRASPSRSGKGTVMTGKRRKTSLDERIRIVEDYLSSGATYVEVAEKHDVSYQQLYQWVQKYNKNGVDGLIDRRGQSKRPEEMTEVEKLQAENRILKAKLERKELENIFLKKVDEIERRRS